MPGFRPHLGAQLPRHRVERRIPLCVYHTVSPKRGPAHKQGRSALRMCSGHTGFSNSALQTPRGSCAYPHNPRIRLLSHRSRAVDYVFDVVRLTSPRGSRRWSSYPKHQLCPCGHLRPTAGATQNRPAGSVQRSSGSPTSPAQTNRVDVPGASGLFSRGFSSPPSERQVATARQHERNEQRFIRNEQAFRPGGPAGHPETAKQAQPALLSSSSPPSLCETAGAGGKNPVECMRMREVLAETQPSACSGRVIRAP